MLLHRAAAGRVRGAVDVPREQVVVEVPGLIAGHVIPPARSWRRCALARCSRVLTVFWGTPSIWAASFVVSPSRTVAWTTARISGLSRPSAAPRSPYSTPSSTRSSALGSGVASQFSRGESRASGRPRSRETSRRTAMPHSQAATSPSPRNRPAPRQAAVKQSWSASATRSGSLHRRVSRTDSQWACRA